MLLRAIFVDDSVEVSCDVISSIRAKLLYTNSISRVTESVSFVKTGHNWINLKTTDIADDFTSHLLNYSVSKWHSAMTEERINIANYIGKIISQPTDLEDQRQTNSFSGRMWK